MDNILNSIHYRNNANWILRCVLYLLTFFGVFIFMNLFVVLINYNAQSISILMELLAFLVMILASFFTVFIFEKSKITSRFGFRRSNFFKKYLTGYFIGFILIILSSIPVILFFSVEFTLSQPILWNTILLYFIFFVVQGASEEILVRGLFFPVIVKHSSPIVAIVFTSLGFAALHLFNDGITFFSFINIALAGALFGYCVLYFDSLWEACALHSAWNFVQGNVLGFKVSGMKIGDSIFYVETKGSSFFTGGIFGIEGSVFCTITLIVICIILHLLCEKKGISILSKSELI